MYWQIFYFDPAFLQRYIKYTLLHSSKRLAFSFLSYLDALFRLQSLAGP